jgi:urease accessory protein
LRLSAVLLLCLAPLPAAAHLVSTRFGELYSGILHPLTALPHLVPWLALALLGALQDNRSARWAVPGFPAAVVTGIVLADLGVVIPQAQLVTAASFVLLGLMVSLKMRTPAWLFVAIVAVVGVTQGHGNAAPELIGSAAVMYAAGVALAAYVTVTVVTASGQLVDRTGPWGTVALRAAGSWITAAGLIYAGFLVAAA